MVMPAVAGSVAGSVVSGGFGLASAKQVNDNMMDLSNSRYQRTVADMKKAGLNPILAATGPSTAGSVPQMVNPADSAAKTAGAAVKGITDTANSAANVKLKQTMGEKAVAETNNAVKSGELIDAQRAKTLADTQVSINSAKNLEADYNKKKLVGDLYHEAGGIVNDGLDYLHNFFGGTKPKTVGGLQTKSGQTHSAKSAPKHFADERPRIWEPDYKERMKQYRKFTKYMDSIKGK